MKKALFRGVRGIPGLIVLGLMATTLVLTVLNPGVFVALLSETVIVQRALAESYVKFPVPPPSSITQIVPPVTKRRSPALEVPALAMSQITPGINVRVNSNPGTLTRPQVEPSVASNPTDPRQLAAGFADYLSNPPLNDAAPGVARSTDGGQTWFVPAGGAILPNPPGFIWGNRSLATNLAAGDSAVAWGPGNVVYRSTLGSETK